MLILDIITPEKKLFSGAIRIVKLPGTMGAFEIMENHAAIISTLSKGTVRVKELSGTVTNFEIDGGLVEVSDNEVKVLVEM